MARYLVTGAAGFIGGHLARALQATGHNVTAFDRSDGDDICDARKVSAAMRDVDGVFHLAAVASVQACLDDPAGTLRTNVEGTQNVMLAAAEKSVNVVYASSAAIYGDLDTLPLMETMQPRPLSLYAMHKLANEATARALGAQKNLASCGLRFFNVYGHGQDPRSPYAGVISRFMDWLQTGQELVLQGDGGQTRDFVAVADAVSALMLAMGTACRREAPVYNIATGNPVSLMDLIRTLEAVTGKISRISHGPSRLGDIRHSQGDAAAFTGRTGWQPQVSLQDGLSAMLAGAPDNPATARQSALV